MSSPSSPEQIARYRVEKKLGEGQMGEVFAATTPEGARVALKVLRMAGAQTEELHRRFRREASLCTKLRHPNVIAVEDYGVHEGSPFLTMQLLKGFDLDDCLDRCGPLEPAVAVAIALDACAGVAAAHARAIVHRDLKPANVFLDQQSDGTVRVVVCDFGVAKVYDDDGALTASGAVVGTPLYMAPEQLIDAKRVDARCDVWALGMLLYHLLAGRSAFADLRGLGDLIVALGENRIPSLQTFAPWVPPALARVVHAALLPHDDRFASVDELVQAIRAWGPPPARLTLDALAPIGAGQRERVSTRALLPKKASELGTPDDATMAEREVSPSAKSLLPADPLLGALVGDRYRIASKLGGGGMGTVYAAKDEKASGDEPVDVAIKVMVASDGGTEGSRRLVREAKAAARIESEHVTKVLAWGVDASSKAPYLVMERLNGMDLSNLLAMSGALEPEVAVALCLQAAEGLRAAHALGIVHRDIKPSNLFLNEAADGIVTLKVCDFGIAKQLVREDVSASTELTHTGGLLGSPLYMSPEQARSAKNVDERSDVFSLTLTLHEALSGAKPWTGRSSMGEIILAVCTEDVPSLSTCAPWVMPELADIVSRGLARDLDKRTGTVAALAAALETYGRSGPLQMKDLAPVSDSRRAKVHSRPADAPRTASGISIPAPRAVPSPSRIFPFVIGGLALVGAGVIGARVFREPTPTTPAPAVGVSATSERLPTPSVTEAPVAPSSAPSSSATPPPSSAPSSSSDKRNVVRPPQTAPKPTASVPPATTASTAPTTGRGNTATDLPP